jgi:galactonate dehydratase
MLPGIARRRARLLQVIAGSRAASQNATDRRLEIAEVEGFPVREPTSRRRYTVLRLRTAGGLIGWGEAPGLSAADLGAARATLVGAQATSYAALDARLGEAAGAINLALLDLVGKLANAPVCQVLGGPTRAKARALATVRGETDAELASGCRRARDAGFRAFSIPVPRPAARNQGRQYAAAVRRRLETLRGALGDDSDFVLDGGGALSPGDAATVSAELERFHLLWLDEPCALSSLRSASLPSDSGALSPVWALRSICCARGSPTS